MNVPPKKRRSRLLKLIAAVLLLGGAAVLLSRLLLYPHTFPGKFDRIRLGMTEAEVRQVLGQPPTAPSPWQALPQHGKVLRTMTCSKEQGLEVVRVYEGDQAEDDAAGLFFAQMFGGIRKFTEEADGRVTVTIKTGESKLLSWQSPGAWIYVGLDAQDRVSTKTWVEVQHSSNVWRRFRAWLGWQ